jgi:hypothetical protein
MVSGNEGTGSTVAFAEGSKCKQKYVTVKSKCKKYVTVVEVKTCVASV